MGLTGYAGIPGDAKAEIGRPDESKWVCGKCAKKYEDVIER